MIEKSQLMPLADIQALIQDVPDFPSPGIVFKDITPVLQDHQAFRSIAAYFAESIEQKPDKLLAIESRGFIFAAALSQIIDAGMVLVRKPGKLPRETVSYSYDLEYGSDTLEVHSDAVKPGEKVMVIDDVLATGGTAQAVEKLCEKVGADILGHRFLMEIAGLKGRDKLSAPIKSFFQV